jgi:hypothetical protein
LPTIQRAGYKRHSVISFKNKLVKKITLLFLLVSFIARGNTYYVATNGKDSNDGVSVSTPFLTITKAVGLAKAGDQILVMEGDYSSTSAINLSALGTEDAPIRLEGYENGRVRIIFSGGSGKGISLSGNYWYVKGFDITKSANNGIKVTGGFNTLEFCSSYDNGNSGIQLSNGAHDNRIINCDSYWNVDTDNYSDADGFACKMDVGDNNYFYGCRSWTNVDDGWDGYLRGADDVHTTVENCWTWGNGYLKDGTDKGYHANGQGFKMGGSDDKTLKHNFTLRNCLAFDNKANGVDQNNNKGTMVIQNCTAFRNNKVIDYSADGDGVLKGNNFNIYFALASGKSCTVQNCLSYDGPVVMMSWVMQNTNSWQSSFTVSDDDFLSLDTTGVSGNRQEDGSLPKLNFCRLRKNSDLVDSGTHIGLDFLGNGPDIGAFECDSINSHESSAVLSNKTVVFFAGDKLMIRRNMASEGSLRLITLNGHQILQKKIKEAAEDIDCCGLAKGVYLVVLSGEADNSIVKVVR